MPILWVKGPQVTFWFLSSFLSIKHPLLPNFGISILVYLLGYFLCFGSLLLSISLWTNFSVYSLIFCKIILKLTSEAFPLWKYIHLRSFQITRFLCLNLSAISDVCLIRAFQFLRAPLLTESHLNADPLSGGALRNWKALITPTSEKAERGKHKNLVFWKLRRWMYFQSGKVSEVSFKITLQEVREETDKVCSARD